MGKFFEKFKAHRNNTSYEDSEEDDCIFTSAIFENGGIKIKEKAKKIFWVSIAATIIVAFLLSVEIDIGYSGLVIKEFYAGRYFGILAGGITQAFITGFTITAIGEITHKSIIIDNCSNYILTKLLIVEKKLDKIEGKMIVPQEKQEENQQ